MPDAAWDFDVRRVVLDGLAIDAGQRLGMVLVQPNYEVVPNGPVAFRIADEARTRQIALLLQAFQVREVESRERGIGVPFVLFPEYSIPVADPDGLDAVRGHLSRIPGDAVFIGGLEGLSREELEHVARRWLPEDTPGPNLGAGAFTNVCAIAVKYADGAIDWYFQAKLRPSKWEQPRNMAQGREVLHFVAPKISFLCQICFDHVAAQGQDSLNTALCQKVVALTTPNAAALDLVFVPQYNPSPNAPIVRQNSSRLLSYQDRLLKNDLAAVVVINKAAASQEPTESFGRSGLHYRQGRWQVPQADFGPKGYELLDSDDLTSAIFRMRTEAIHVSTFVPPSQNVHGPGNPRVPLENPRSYFIGENGCCTCVAGCARAQFVECECLPCKLHDVLPTSFAVQDDLRRWEGATLDQTQLLGRHYWDIRTRLFSLGTDRSSELVAILLQMHDSGQGNPRNPDLWSDLQAEAIAEFTAGLSILNELQPLSFDTEKPWTALSGESFALILVDGAGKRKRWSEVVEEYYRQFGGQYHALGMRKRKILLAALRSEGHINPLIKPHQFDITEPTQQNRLGDGDAFTRPIPLQFFVCLDSLFSAAREAPTVADFLKTEMRCLLE